MRKLFLFALLFSVLLESVRADVTPDNSTGVEPLYSYKGGLNEAINLFNGNLNVTLPLLALKGRAGLDLAVVLSYDSRQMKYWSDEIGAGHADWNFTGRTMGRWTTNFYPYVKEYSEQSGSNLRWKAEITLEGGTQHQFDTGVYLPPPTKGVGKSTNATDMQYDFDNHILRMKNGVWYQFPTDANPNQILKGDANGNYLKFVLDTYGKTTQIIDTLGRTVNIFYENPSDSNLPSRLTVLNNAGVALTYSFSYEFVPVNTAAYGYQGPNGTFPLLTGIALPDGKSWSFSYYDQPSPGRPSTLLLARVDYPMGGYSRYNYSCCTATADNNTMNSKLVHKIVNANNGQGELTTIYDPTFRRVTEPDGSYQNYGFNSDGTEYGCWHYTSDGRAIKLDWKGYMPDGNNINRLTLVWTYANLLYPGTGAAWFYKSQTTYAYDAAGNVTREDIYDYSSSLGWIDRRQTIRTFLSLPNYIYRVSQENVYDLDQFSNSTLVSQTAYAYDQFALLRAVKPAVSRATTMQITVLVLAHAEIQPRFPAGLHPRAGGSTY